MMNVEHNTSLTHDEYMRKPEVIKRTTLSDSTIRRMESKGLFPKRRLVGERVVGWYRDQVLHWIATREVIDLH